MQKKRIAIIGAGVSGLSASWLLHKDYELSLFEKNDYLGGHTNTVIVEDAGWELPVDTGFIVFNDRNYPNLLGLFDELSVDSRPSDMSFAFSLSDEKRSGVLEYAGSNLNTLFAQRRNLLRPKHWQLLREILRFNRVAQNTLLFSPSDTTLPSLGAFLSQHGFSKDLQAHYLLPMGAAIWSCPVETMLEFPARSFLQFFDNHGLLGIKNRPQWYTVTGGSFRYVQCMRKTLDQHIQLKPAATRVNRDEQHVWVSTDQERLAFDAVIFACHADQALALLSDTDDQEEKILSAFEYEHNHTYLHRDPRLMPQRKRVWSSWNYLAQTRPDSGQQMTASYWMNHLQGFESEHDYFVTLNPYELPRDELILKEIHYEHPIFTEKAIQAQQALPNLQGNRNTWFCGSYAGYGFHEDAVKSAVRVCEYFGIPPRWQKDQANECIQPNSALVKNTLREAV